MGDAGEINGLDFRVENHYVDVRDRSMKPRQTLCNRTTTVHVVSLQPNNNRLHDVSYKRSVEFGDASASAQQIFWQSLNRMRVDDTLLSAMTVLGKIPCLSGGLQSSADFLRTY